MNINGVKNHAFKGNMMYARNIRLFL